ncbi:MAG: 3D domain-containing protein [Oscillospiraceae bacterium]|nr:3D domain-containing protein [Oscillospiraceae bacterium]
MKNRLRNLTQNLAMLLLSARYIVGVRMRALGSRLAVGMLASVLAVVIYAGHLPGQIFVIKDSNADDVVVHKTNTNDPGLALQEADVHIRNHDYVSLPDKQPSGNTTEIQVVRANTVSVTLNGQTKEITSLGGTVGDVLDRAGYAPDENDVISHDLDASLEDDMKIKVHRIEVVSETKTKSLAFKEIRNKNTTMRKDSELVTSEGKKGKAVYTYNVTYRDGVPVSRQIASKEIIEPAQNRVIEQGVYEKPTPAPGQPEKEDLAKKAPRLKDLKYSKVIEVTCSAYTTEGKSRKLNASGKIARKGTIAVDPRVVPLGSRVYVKSSNGTWIYGTAVAEDTGGAIKGNKIDLFFNTRAECIRFGIRKAHMYILD